MASINPFYVLGLLAWEILVLLIYGSYYALDSSKFIVLLFFAVAINFCYLWAVGDYADTFMEIYFLRIFFILFFLLLMTLFTDVETGDSPVGQIQREARISINSISSSLGFEAPYKIKDLNVLCRLGVDGCDCFCPCSGMSGMDAYCKKNGCICVSQGSKPRVDDLQGYTINVTLS